MSELDPLLVDPFESQHQVYRDKSRWQMLCAVQAVLMAFLTAAVLFLALRPPMVIVKDRLHGEPPAISLGSSEPAITEADARIFFVNMLKLRFAWDSLTVSRDMQAFLGQCYRDQRQAEMAHLHEDVAMDRDDSEDKQPRLLAWVKASITNTLILPERLDEVRCLKKDGIWHCSAQGSVITQNLSPPFRQPAPQQHLAFAATLLEVRHTPGTPYGLIIGAMRQFPRGPQTAKQEH